MRPSFAIVLAIVLCIALHVLLGWAFTVLGAASGAALANRRGWMVGLVGGAASWLLLATWSRTVDAAAVDEMLRVVGAILGNLPGVAVFLATVAIGAVLGLAGGWLGAATRNLLAPTGR